MGRSGESFKPLSRGKVYFKMMSSKEKYVSIINVGIECIFTYTVM